MNCSLCGEPINVPGALVFSPPNADDVCTKYHVCLTCWDTHYVVIGSGRWTVEHSFECRMSGVTQCEYHVATDNMMNDGMTGDFIADNEHFFPKDGRWRIDKVEKADEFEAEFAYQPQPAYTLSFISAPALAEGTIPPTFTIRPDSGMRCRYELQGGHYHCHIFGPYSGKAGTLIIRESEWDRFRSIHPHWSFIDVATLKETP